MSTFESGLGTTAGELAVAGAGDRIISRRSVASWVMYDLANTIFSMGIVSLYFPTFIRRSVGGDRADAYYGFITAISMGIIFVVSPLLGAMTDRARRRMPFLIASTLICVALTLGMGRTGFTPTIILFILANITYQAGLQFYDALLPEVSTEENRGKIGGIGVGVGYLGSYLAVGIGFIISGDNMPLLFTVVAMLFLLFALPAFFFVKERGNPNPQPINLRMTIESTRNTIRTLRSSNEYPGLLRFLIGRMFYTDAINTVISIMVLYTISISVATGMTADQGEAQARLVMMTAITFAVIGGFAWGWMSDRIGPKRTLNYVLSMWMVVFLGAAAVGLFGLPVWALFIVACSAGFCLGGIWAADRPLMLRLTPPDRIGEFYGLYGMVGRFSAITGPLLWGLVLTQTRAAGIATPVGQGIGVLTLLIMMIISFIILRPVSDEPRGRLSQ